MPGSGRQPGPAESPAGCWTAEALSQHQEEAAGPSALQRGGQMLTWVVSP